METQTINNETISSLSQLLDTELNSEALQLLGSTNNRYLRDLKVNVQNALQYQTLTPKESMLLAFAVAKNHKNQVLEITFKNLAIKAGATNAELAETVACVSLLNANNVLYRFRHFVNKDTYNNAPAGIKMSIMMNPVLGKEFFELMSLTISALNGCEMCVNAHEQSLIHLNCSEQRIFDAIKLTAIIKSFVTLI